MAACDLVGPSAGIELMAEPQPESPSPRPAPTRPMGTPAAAGPGPVATGSVVAPEARLTERAAGPITLAIRFTGSGSEYFRIWLVNLLLVVVTVGIYYPWAKVRRLRYFYANTLVGNNAVGRHALRFHGDPKRMLIGYLITSALFVLYSIAGTVSAVAGAVALVALAVVWPAFIRAGLRFRLSNTSWRGLRFAFDGTLSGAYRVLLPLVVPLALAVASTVLFEVWADDGGDPSPPLAASAGVAMLVLAVVVACLMAPWILVRLRRYQHDNYRFGSVVARLDIRGSAIYRLLMKTSLVTVATIAVVLGTVGALAAWWFLSGDAAGPQTGDRSRIPPWLVAIAPIVFGLLPLLLVAAAQLVIVPYVTARLQNLFWSATRSEAVQFDSQLSFAKLARLTAFNWLMIIVTLGLYWPFARVAVARLRLEAVVLHLRDDPATIIGEARSRDPGNTGDAAADVFGFDPGF